MQDSQHSMEINVRLTVVDESFAVLRFEGFGAPAHSVAIEWRGPGGSGDRIPVAVVAQSLPPSGTCEVRMTVEELLWATSSSFKKRDRNRNVAPYVVVLDRAGRELAHSAQPVDLSLPTRSRANTLMGRWRRADKVQAAGAQDRRSLGTAAAGGSPSARGVGGRVATRVAAAVLAAAFMLGFLALARPVVLATLAAADVEEPIKVEAGSRGFACLGDSARFPSTFGVFGATSLVLPKGRIEVKPDKNPNGRDGCQKNLIEVFATADAPPGSYASTYRVSDFIFEKTAALRIQVEEGASLDAMNHDVACLPQGASTTIGLASNVALRARAPVVAHVDPSFGPIDVSPPDQRPPFQVRIMAHRNGSGPAEFTFHFAAGARTGTTATVRITVQPACGTPPGTTGPTGTTSPTSTRTTTSTTRVPMKHGFILADFGAGFSRLPGGALPAVDVVKPPQYAQAHAVGQFIVLDVTATPGQRDGIDYRVTPPNGPLEQRHVDIVYDDVCSPDVPGEELLYMPAGQYFAPPAGPGADKIRLLFFTRLATLQGVNDKVESITVGQPFCLQAADQQMTQEIRRIFSAAQAGKLSFDTASALATRMSAHYGKTYALPRTPEWVAGLILVLAVGDSQAGDTAFNAALKRSYQGAYYEWVDERHGRDDPVTQYLFGPGPSGAQSVTWLAWERKNFVSDYVRVRFKREP